MTGGIASDIFRYFRPPAVASLPPHMIRTSLLLLAVSTLLWAGCSSNSAKVDRGTLKASSFAFVENASRPTAAFADKREETHKLIQEAITRNLGAQGVKRVDSGGDIKVAYLIIVGNNASTLAINDYFGYGRDATALQEKAQKAYTKSKAPDYFEAGTLLIDLIDAKTYQLLQRHHATRPLLGENATTAERAAHIQGAVDEALAGLRVAR